MKKQLKELILGLSGSSLSITFALGLLSSSLPSLAQVDSQLKPGQFENNAEKDPYFGGNNSGDFNIFNLMRNAQMGTLRNSSELIEEQRQDWDKGTEDFLRQQRERLGKPAIPTQTSGN
ncbi:hypothetical protein [Merismopedia glauca]|uniref:Uncharacterized protein n=1 Tax=Merismopedia glauca CCAP 1448/3 TaxID=1296344 RepID=A0A2T1CA75_9CYAN|nr:hypothetical protein [Merismopedia glauca]PSB05172.1 hypothetical protein C7B64_00565 [Merismopedia glauca CCAP 1448/3]